jgi:hypothetical protein
MEDLAGAPPAVRAVLVALQEGIPKALEGNLVGLYLTGSLTYGDFEPGSSDIDYLAVMERPIDGFQRRALAALHADIGRGQPEWRERIEGSYVTTGMLPSIEPPTLPRPYINRGEFWDPDPAYGNEWLINRYALQTCGIPLAGPPITTLASPVSVEQVREASARDLFEEWVPQLDDPTFLPDSHHEAYVCLTMCRILHRQFNNEVVSKRVAAAWVRPRVPARWQRLIDEALGWEHGLVLERRDEVRSLVAFTAGVLSAQARSWTDDQAAGTEGRAGEGGPA